VSQKKSKSLLFLQWRR